MEPRVSSPKSVDLKALPIRRVVRFRTEDGARYVVIKKEEDASRKVGFVSGITITSDSRSTQPDTEHMLGRRTIEVGKSWEYGPGFRTASVTEIDVQPVGR